MSSTISASSATEPSKTNDAPERSPLEQLIDRAKLASEHMGVQNPNRALLREMAMAIVSLARMNADLMQQVADKPRILTP